MADVTVTRRADGDPMRFDVAVREGDATTEHDVTVSEATSSGSGRAVARGVRPRCFAFLLERERRSRSCRRSTSA
jgi:hypothetical protein